MRSEREGSSRDERGQVFHLYVDPSRGPTHIFVHNQVVSNPAYDLPGKQFGEKKLSVQQLSLQETGSKFLLGLHYYQRRPTTEQSTEDFDPTLDNELTTSIEDALKSGNNAEQINQVYKSILKKNAYLSDGEIQLIIDRVKKDYIQAALDNLSVEDY